MQEQPTSYWSSGPDLVQQMDHFKLVKMAAALFASDGFVSLASHGS